ncbi:hypothetical protein [Haliea sp. E17]|uniref:hypothetical protein n=1 Tax=Haliea sp. E17 TaxID=3401576 RepID=UPI003AAAE0ED
MRFSSISFLTLLALANGSNLSLAAEPSGDFPGVEGLMSDQEYRAAGLDKLSPQERDALNQWLIHYTAWEAPRLRESSDAVKSLEEIEGLSANVKPPFKGWSGKTRFYLDNGEVWEQRVSGRFYYPGEDTAVTIRRNTLGFFEMEHVASGRSVGVKKIK